MTMQKGKQDTLSGMIKNGLFKSLMRGEVYLS